MVSHSGEPDSLPGPSMRDLLSTLRHRATSSLHIIFPPLLHIHSRIIRRKDDGPNSGRCCKRHAPPHTLKIKKLTFILLMWRIYWAPNSIPIYIQQDATLHSLYISGNCSIRFEWYFHPSSGAHTTVSTASGICHTVTAICRYRGRDGTGFSVLWVACATHSTLKYQIP